MTRSSHRPPVHRLELRLRCVDQLFNSLDPSPFHEKDLDADAEAFLVGWARELPEHDSIALQIDIEAEEGAAAEEDLVRHAVHHYFAERANVTKREFAELMRQGRTTLVIGLLFLLLCFSAREVLGWLGEGTLVSFARESVIIAGWVAMWRPMQIYLYDGWPLRRRERLFRRMSRMPVHVRSRRRAAGASAAAVAPPPNGAGGSSTSPPGDATAGQRR